MAKYELITIVVGPIETNCYVLADKSTLRAVIIDPGDNPQIIIKRIEYHKFIPTAIINTHGHADHIIGNQAIKTVYKIPVMIHSADNVFLSDPELNYSHFTGAVTMPSADRQLKGGDLIECGALKLKVIETPGHTPGCICLQCEDLLFTGDTLFCGSIGRTDLPGGDDETMASSLKLFADLPKTLKILPGHGPACTLADEYKHNPYL